MKNVVIVGASLAGVSAVEGLRERGYDGAITLIGAEPELPYDRPPLSKTLLDDHGGQPDLLLHQPDWYTEHQVTLRLGVTASRLDAGQQSLLLDDGSQVGYDGLLIATGSVARPFEAPGTAAAPMTLRTHADALRLEGRLVAGQHLVVIGAGFIGLEAAACARSHGLRVTVVDIAQEPLSQVFGVQVGAWFRRLHERNGVTVRCGVQLTAINADGARNVVELGAERLVADHVVAGVGVVPATSWLAGSGLRLDNGIRCGADLSTGVPGVVAAGDVASWPNPMFGERMRVEHWTNAVEQGRHAAGTLLGAAEPFTSVPYFWTDQYSAKARFVGRVAPSDEVHIEHSADDRLIVAYGRGGVVRGALCIKAARRLAAYRTAIAEHAAWRDVVPNQAASV